MSSEAIQYFDRHSGSVQTEKVYGDGFLRWTYGNPLGRLALHALVKRSLFSRWYGWRMDSPRSKKKVLPFIATYGLRVEDFAEAPESFRTFNEFFYRKLKPGARPIAPDPKAAVFPADGRHLGFQDISKADGMFVKGAVFDLGELLADADLTRRFEGGSLVISRLCPVDYHRFHFPVGGTPERPRLLNGPLYSVNPIALRQNIRIFSENKRACCRIESPEFGSVLMLEIGATCVGSFEYTFKPGAPMAKGDEKGYFKFGGSSTITIFEKGRVRLAEDLLENSRQRRELYARMGEEMARLV